MPVKKDKVIELIYEALETELGGEQIYKTAISCARTPELKEEWQKYLEETKSHQERVLSVVSAFGLDAKQETPGRQVVRHIGQSLVKAMQMASQSAPESAELVASECVTLAETKDHHNWTLLGKLAAEMKGAEGKALQEAVEAVEDQEDEHLYHTRGWSRELWIDALGMPAVLPPPEEEKEVKTMMGAARAEQQREKML